MIEDLNIFLVLGLYKINLIFFFIICKVIPVYTYSIYYLTLLN